MKPLPFLLLLLASSFGGCVGDEPPATVPWWEEVEDLAQGAPVEPTTLALPEGLWTVDTVVDGATVFFQQLGGSEGGRWPYRLEIRPVDPETTPFVAVSLPIIRTADFGSFLGFNAQGRSGWVNESGLLFEGEAAGRAPGDESRYVGTFVAASHPVRIRLELLFDATERREWEPAFSATGAPVLGVRELTHEGLSEHVDAGVDHMFYAAIVGEEPEPPSRRYFEVTGPRLHGDYYDGALNEDGSASDWIRGMGWPSRPSGPFWINVTYEGPAVEQQVVWLMVPIADASFLSDQHGLEIYWPAIDNSARLEQWLKENT